MATYGRKQAIRDKCIDCCAGSRAEVRNCPATNCPLWRFRMGIELKLEDCMQADGDAQDIEEE